MRSVDGTANIAAKCELAGQVLRAFGSLRFAATGDALPAPDRPVTANELLGRVNYLIRAGRLIAVPSELSVVESLIARVVRRSAPAARALVYLHSKVQVPKESVLPCQS
jgi:hypothetical protein